MILRALEKCVDAHLFSAVRHELSVLDETLDLAQEFHGAKFQLQDMYRQKKQLATLATLSMKPLSQLTDLEKTMLKSMGNKIKHT